MGDVGKAKRRMEHEKEPGAELNSEYSNCYTLVGDC